MDEVDVECVDLAHELRQRVELRLGLSPIVARPPIAHELLDLRELHALGLVTDGFPVRPTRRRDSAAKVHERLFRNLHFEGANRIIFFVGLFFLGPGQVRPVAPSLRL